MKRTIAAAVALSALGVAGYAWAFADFSPAATKAGFKIKAGYWQVTFTQANAPSFAAKVCVGETDSSLILALARTPGVKSCSQNDVHLHDGALTQDAVCTLVNGKTETVTLKLTQTGDTAFHETLRSQIPGAGRYADTLTTLDGKWIGGCPFGMASGDMVMPDGTKLSLPLIMGLK